MNYNHLHSITVFFNLVSLNMLHIGVLTLIFSNVTFKTQTDMVIFLASIPLNMNSPKYLFGGYIQIL